MTKVEPESNKIRLSLEVVLTFAVWKLDKIALTLSFDQSPGLLN